MDLISGLKSELFRPLVTLIVPGAVGIGPWIIVTEASLPSVEAFMLNHPTALVACVVTAIIAAGLILEDIGSLIEGKLHDATVRCKHPESDEVWNAYLRLQTKDEVIAQRYLRTMLVRMKFELSMVPALVSGGVGLFFTNQLSGTFSSSVLFGLEAGVFALTVYLYWESRRGADALHELRQAVVDSVRQARSTSVIPEPLIG